jgi:hypothetical protein
MNWTNGQRAAWGYQIGQDEDVLAEAHQNDEYTLWRVELARHEDDARTEIAVGHADGISAAKAEVEAYLRRNGLASNQTTEI